MFFYNLRLAWISIKQNVSLNLLMVCAIGLGIGVSMSMITLYAMMSGNPIPEKSDQLFAVRIDNWDPDEAYTDYQGRETQPFQHSYKDAMVLRSSTIPLRKAAMYKGYFVVEPANDTVAPYGQVVRMTDRDFFAMFNVPFIYGGVWSESANDLGERVVVIAKETNDKLFGGEDSVGRQIKMGEHQYTVTGVIDTWNPLPMFYDLNNKAFGDAELLFMPFAIISHSEFDRAGNTNGWKAERINSHEEFLNSENIWIQFWAELPDAFTQDAFKDWLDSYVLEQKKLGRFPRPLNNALDNVTQWLEVNHVVPDDNRVMLALSFMFLAVCLFNTIGMLLARFMGKVSVVGLRRALGASKFSIFYMHLVEVALVGLGGGLFGLLLSYLGLFMLRESVEGIEKLATMNLPLVLMAIALAIFASVLAGIYPAWRICQISPAHSLKTQ